MSLSAEELQIHCEAIVALSKLTHRIVILCEGNINDIKGRVHLYRRLEIFPDANFYKACIPEWWTEKRPTFVPCGDKTDVLNTYFELKKLNFNEGKLFAIIDLDLQPAKALENYPVENSEQLFNTLYQENKPQLDNIKQHPIFITGLIYKEAYFFVPELKDTFENYPLAILFDDLPLNLNSVYQKMGASFGMDKNLEKHFSIAKQRISYLTQLDLTNITTLQASWRTVFNSAETEEKNALIYALLSIHQIKDYWQLIKSGSEISETRFKEQLTLSIGNFYAKQPPESPHHIPSFFNALSAIA
jgi:hypothetical protein